MSASARAHILTPTKQPINIARTPQKWESNCKGARDQSLDQPHDQRPKNDVLYRYRGTGTCLPVCSGDGSGARACVVFNVGSVQFVCVKNTARLLHEVSVCARVQSCAAGNYEKDDCDKKFLKDEGVDVWQCPLIVEMSKRFLALSACVCSSSDEVTATSASHPSFMSHRGLFNTNRRSLADYPFLPGSGRGSRCRLCTRRYSISSVM